MAEPERPQLTPYQVELEAGKRYAWCRCGRSNKQPFCDGSHAGTGIEPLMFTRNGPNLRCFAAARIPEIPPTATARICCSKSGHAQQISGVVRGKPFLLRRGRARPPRKGLSD
jgi:hypothetical protein